MMRKTSTLGLVALAVAVLVPSLGCASATKVRIGQIKTGGHVKVTEQPRLAIEKADEGFGFNLALGWVEIGATTTHNPEASHLALGIDSSTGFDGEEGTLVTSATRLGVANANIGGELAIGLKRITLNGEAKIDDGPLLPAIYGDHWTGATADYTPFPASPGNVSGDMLLHSKYVTFGPWGATGSLGIICECRPGSFSCADGQFSTGIGPFLLDGGVTNGECTHGFGFGGYLGITDAPE